MLRGVGFKVDNAEDLFLNLHVLMDISRYDWYIDDVDLNYFYFRSGKYSGEEFKDALDEVSTLSFVRIRRYPVGVPEDCIDEYEDFVKSNCDLLILYYDGGYVEIYEKEEELISKTMDFCLNFRFEDPEFKSDLDDPRSYMHF